MTDWKLSPQRRRKLWKSRKNTKQCRVTGITELEGGMFNAIYRIRCTAFDRDIVLKVGVGPGIPLLTYERDIMPVEVEAYRLISERTTVPVPQVLATISARR